MKMNIGTATRTGLEAAEPQMRGSRLKNCTGSNTPSSMPIPPKKIADPAQHERHRVAAEQREGQDREQDQRQR